MQNIRISFVWKCSMPMFNIFASPFTFGCGNGFRRFNAFNGFNSKPDSSYQASVTLIA